MAFDSSRFHEAFFEEAAEHLATVESTLLALESGDDDPELLHAIFRAAHSIKGASGTFGFGDVARFTHVLENLLDRLRQGEMSFSPELGNLLLTSSDVLRGLVDAARHGQPAPADTDTVAARLHAALGGEATACDSAPAEVNATDVAESRRFRVHFAPGEDLLRQGMEPSLLLANLLDLGDAALVRVDASAVPPLDALDPERCYLAWTVELVTSAGPDGLRDVFSFVEDACELTLTPIIADGNAASSADADAPNDAPRGAARGTTDTSSIRVATDKVDKLINLVGELVIAQSMITQVVDEFTPDKLELLREAAAAMARNTRELQERVMSVRMIPIGSTFGRFPRLVRDLAATCGKQVRLRISGEETELDKGVIERIGDPLTHLIRNAVDHGIEPPDERVAAGKPASGTVRLHASHESGNVVIEITDDGRGLDATRIRQKALDSGLIDPEQELSVEECQQLVFLPGFSTAATVSDISGRGVGMDVVKRNVEELNGSITIDSAPGRGTRFRIKLPLTLAIMDGLTLRVADEVYVVPLVDIVESVHVRPEDVRHVLGRGEVVMLRGEVIPLVRLRQVFELPDSDQDAASGLVVIVEHGNRKVGLLVDELLGQAQVVIKNLETNLGRIDGLMGATIMGDGRVALIIDAAALIRLEVRPEPKRRAA
jgi:two-component system chemotaxis sensor kinase CheA